MTAEAQPEERPIGLVGLGLMGRGIATCMLAYGCNIVAFDRRPRQVDSSIEHIAESLLDMVDRNLIAEENTKEWSGRYQLADSLAGLHECRFVVETAPEDLTLKREIYAQLEQVVAADAVIASNTSSIPITVLQQERLHPERFVGMHWGEPVQVMRYLEIIPGKFTSQSTVQAAKRLGEQCRKEPTILKTDIRGFVSNRMMYAMMREACFLVEKGIADIEDVDRSFRNDIGCWATIAGPFRWMDLTGIPGYATVMEDLFPELCNSSKLPELMKSAVKEGALGVSNQLGFYQYDERTAREWQEVWVDFVYDLRALVEKYERRVRL